MSTRPPGGVAAPLAFLTGSRLVINTAQRFVYPFLPAISRGLGVSLDTAGLLVSARWGAGLATPALVATVGRGEQRRRLIGFGLALFAVGAAVTAATSTFVGALVGFVLMGLAKPVHDISAMAYLSDRVPYDRRARYLAVLELTWSGGLLIGAPVAGWLIDGIGWQAPFWAIAALSGLALGLRNRILDPDNGPVASRRGGSSTWTRSSIALLGVIALFSAAAEVVFVVFGAWFEIEFGLSLVALGGTAVVIGLVELAAEGATVGFTDRVGKKRAVGLGLVVGAAGWIVIVIWGGDSHGWGLAGLLVGIAGFEYTVVSSIPLASEVRPEGRASYLSWMIVATSVGRAAGAALGSPIFTGSSIEVNAGIAGGANLLAVVVLALWVREHASDRPVDMVLPE